MVDVKDKRDNIREESRKEMADSIPKIAVNLGLAFLIWLFGVLVFLPLSRSLTDPTLMGLIGLDKIVSAIMLVVLIVILLRILKEVKDVTDAFAGYATLWLSGEEASEERIHKYRTAFRGIGYIIVAIIAYLFFLPFIAGIFRALAGLILIVLVLVVIAILFTVGDAFSEHIETHAVKFVKWTDNLRDRMEQERTELLGDKEKPKEKREEPPK
ncbi:MAG: hypothetical protein SVY15_06385 [Halobacteriota archaeon]|nr:hypothetical protein [Halobacteriota archaeon]